MSNFIPNRPNRVNPLIRRSFAIVASQYNSDLMDQLVSATKAELELLAPNATITIYEVPGAFEIPIMLQEVALAGGNDAIIALGVIIEGSTAHADLIARSITHSLMDIALRFRTPVIHEVLLVKDRSQAILRTTGVDKNRGQEAARAAVRISQTVTDFKQRHPAV